jgi:hypothetical protein
MDVCPRISVLCCPVYVEAFATGWSLFQKSPTKFVNRLRNLCVWSVQGPYKDCRATDDDDDYDDDTLPILFLNMEGSIQTMKKPTIFVSHLILYAHV